MDKIYEQGNFELQTKTFNGTASNPSYENDTHSWYGLMEISLSFTQDTTAIAADDDADYLSMTPPLRASGTVHITGMPLKDYQRLFNVKRSAENGGYIFGARGAKKKIGISFKNTVMNDDEIYATQKFILYKATVSLPDIGTESLDEDGTTIRDFTMNIDAGYIFYNRTEGGKTIKDTATFGMYDSVNHSAIWNIIKDEIFLPDDEKTFNQVVSAAGIGNNVTVTATKNGSSMTLGTDTVTAGDKVVFTVVYAEGYEKDVLTINDKAYTSGTEYIVDYDGLYLVATAKASA